MSFLTLIDTPDGKKFRADSSGKFVLSSTDAEPCCCYTPVVPCIVTLCNNVNKTGATDFLINCKAPPIFVHTVVLPDAVALPTKINIKGFVNDDLLINGQSITLDLGLDPGPYLDTVGAYCVGAHQIGCKSGPYQDVMRGGITFPWSQREFTLACRDTIGAGAGIEIDVCVNPGAPVVFSCGGTWSDPAAWFRDKGCATPVNIPAEKVDPYSPCPIPTAAVPNNETITFISGDMTGTGTAKAVYVDAPESVTPYTVCPCVNVAVLFSCGGDWSSPATWFLDRACTYPANVIPDDNTVVYISGDMTGAGTAKVVYVDAPAPDAVSAPFLPCSFIHENETENETSS